MADIIHVGGGALTKELLVQTAKYASESGMKYMGLIVFMPNTPRPELIINSDVNFEAKLDYYTSSYDDELKHKFSKDVCITEARFTRSIADFENLY